MKISDIIKTGTSININAHNRFPYGNVISITLRKRGCEINQIHSHGEWDAHKAEILETMFHKILKHFKEDIL